MRKAYRNMMGQVTLSEEAREGMLKELEGAPAGKKRVPLGRVAMAVCLCLALALPIGALVERLRLEVRVGDGGWEVKSPARVPESSFSQRIWDLVADWNPEEDGLHPYAVADVAGAEAFLGVPLPNNPLLDGAEALTEQLVITNGEGATVSSHCFVSLSRGVKGLQGQDREEKILLGAYIWATYSYQGMPVRLSYSIDAAPDGYFHASDDFKTVYGGDIPAEPEVESYVTSSGRECALILQKGGRYWNCSGYAVVDNVSVELQVRADGRDAARAAVVKLLDAYG